MRIDRFMDQYQKDLRSERPFNTTPGSYTIPYEDGTKLHLNTLPNANGFTLSCNILKFPKENEEALYLHALRANLFGKGTAGAALGLIEEEDGNVLTLSKTIDYNIIYKEFKELIEDFLSVVDFWREEVQNKNYLTKK